MASEKQNKPIEQIKELEQFIPKEKQEELAQLLVFGEKYKKEGADLKNDFWVKHDRDDYLNLITQYEESEQKFINGLSEEEKKIINSLKGISKGKFYKEYLTERILYSGNPESVVGKFESRKFGKEILQEGWNGKLQPGVSINLDYNDKIRVEELPILVDLLENNVQPGMIINLNFCKSLGNDGAIALSKIELKEGCGLYLCDNGIGDDGVKAIAQNLELKEGAYLGLSENKNIGKEGYEALAGMKMKRGVTLNLSNNDMGNDGAEAISKIKLEEGATLDLAFNTNIGKEGYKALADMEMKKGVTLNFSCNDMGNDGAEAISKIKLEEGVTLNLFSNNNIGKEGYEALAGMEMKKGVTLDFTRNKIGTSGLEAISKMKLKEGMTLKLRGDPFMKYINSEQGLDLILDNLELKDGVTLDLSGNDMPNRMKLKCKDLENIYKEEGIDCKILVD